MGAPQMAVRPHTIGEGGKGSHKKRKDLCTIEQIKTRRDVTHQKGGPFYKTTTTRKTKIPRKDTVPCVPSSSAYD